MKILDNKPLPEIQQDQVCKTHPDAPHGFDRNASPVLNRVKAEAYREMATFFENYGPRLAIDQLRKMADAIEKGEGL